MNILKIQVYSIDPNRYGYRNPRANVSVYACTYNNINNNNNSSNDNNNNVCKCHQISFYTCRFVGQRFSQERSSARIGFHKCSNVIQLWDRLGTFMNWKFNTLNLTIPCANVTSPFCRLSVKQETTAATTDHPGCLLFAKKLHGICRYLPRLGSKGWDRSR